MKAGGSKQKGASFERDTCRRLSLWVSNGKREDLFWRSAMSGGRATVAGRRGVNLASQAGDISAVDKAGHVLTAELYFETKHVKDISLANFIIKNTGPLARYWQTACKESANYDKTPVLIIRQNRFPTLLITLPNVMQLLCKERLPSGSELARVYTKWGRCVIWDFEQTLRVPFGYKPKP